MPNRPRFSIVSAACDVAQHLPDFIASIERQTIGFEAIEVIAVDDGSTDDTREILEAWAARSPERVRVLGQPNGGAAAARNLGLAVATGDWVTFSDPDDELDLDALAVADAFARAHPDVQVMAMRQQLIDEERGVIREPRVRNAPFEAGDRVADLDLEPATLIGSSSASLYALDRIRTTGIAFDPRIRVVEDGHFAMRFVLELDRPRVGLLRDARYRHRLSHDRPSGREGRWDLPDRYGITLELGFIDLVERSKARHGIVPPWLQAQLLHELSYYLSEDARMGSRSHLPPELSDRFHDLFGRLLRELDPELVRRFDVPPYEHRFDDIVIHAYRDVAWRSRTAWRTRIDEKMALQRIEYHCGGPLPDEAVRIDGVPATPAWSKTVTVTCFGREVMTERLLWLPVRGQLELELDGVALPVRTPDPGANPTNSLTRRAARRRARKADTVVKRERRGLLARLRLRARLRSTIVRARRAAVRAAAFGPIGNRYRGAWVFIDRFYTANDNGERLFDHVRADRPDINAWFVVEEGSDAWIRLRAARVDRLIAYGSWRWKLLMLRSAWVVSSHVDDAISAPIRLAGLLDRPTWRFAFLQHGVIIDDLAAWFNLKEFELFVASTDDELRSIVSDGTRYRLTRKECRNIGLPRWDRLLELGRAVDEADRNLVVIMPTWRMWLTLPLDKTTQKRGVRDSIWESEYLKSWLAILRSDEIAAAAARNGRQLVYVPHPNIRPILEEIRLPDHVRAVPIDGDDIQSLFARAALFVTDYSSACFDAAVLDRPIVYYQFDRGLEREGGHVGRKGYFEYDRDGFGPVVFDHESAVAAIVASLDAGPRAAPEYQRRIDATFAGNRDGRACERAIATIEEMSRPWQPPDRAAAPTGEGQARRA